MLDESRLAVAEGPELGRRRLAALHQPVQTVVLTLPVAAAYMETRYNDLAMQMRRKPDLIHADRSEQLVYRELARLTKLCLRMLRVYLLRHENGDIGALFRQRGSVREMEAQVKVMTLLLCEKLDQREGRIMSDCLRLLRSSTQVHMGMVKEALAEFMEQHMEAAPPAVRTERLEFLQCLVQGQHLLGRIEGHERAHLSPVRAAWRRLLVTQQKQYVVTCLRMVPLYRTYARSVSRCVAEFLQAYRRGWLLPEEQVDTDNLLVALERRSGLVSRSSSVSDKVAPGQHGVVAVCGSMATAVGSDERLVSSVGAAKTGAGSGGGSGLLEVLKTSWRQRRAVKAQHRVDRRVIGHSGYGESNTAHDASNAVPEGDLDHLDVEPEGDALQRIFDLFTLHDSPVKASSHRPRSDDEAPALAEAGGVANAELYCSTIAVLGRRCTAQVQYTADFPTADCEDELAVEEELGGKGMAILEAKRELRKARQIELVERGAARMVVAMLAGCGGQVTRAVDSTIIFACALLNGGTHEVQAAMLDELRSGDGLRCLATLEQLLAQCPVPDVDYLVRATEAHPRGADSLAGVAPGSAVHRPINLVRLQNDAKYARHLFRMLQLLCEGHNSTFQNFLRTQPGNNTTHNLVQETGTWGWGGGGCFDKLCCRCCPYLVSLCANSTLLFL